MSVRDAFVFKGCGNFIMFIIYNVAQFSTPCFMYRTIKTIPNDNVELLTEMKISQFSTPQNVVVLFICRVLLKSYRSLFFVLSFPFSRTHLRTSTFKNWKKKKNPYFIGEAPKAQNKNNFRFPSVCFFVGMHENCTMLNNFYIPESLLLIHLAPLFYSSTAYMWHSWWCSFHEKICYLIKGK